MSTLSTAEMAIFAVLCLPTLYVLFKHGWVGFLGWMYLFVFCTLRVLGGGLALGGSKSANIISNIGLSPLLLALSGILHEVRHYAIAGLNKKVEWVAVAIYHQFVLVAVIILALGSSGLQGSDPSPKDLTMVKAGSALLTVCWVALAAWILFTFRALRISTFTPKLFWGAFIALVFTGVRVIYSLVALVTQEPSLNPSTGYLSVRVVLSLIPELVSTLALLAGGFLDRNIRRDIKGRGLPSTEPSSV